MNRMKDKLELSGKARFLLFVISFVLLLAGTFFAERSIVVTLLLILAGAAVGLVASAGMLTDRRYKFMRRGSVPENRHFDDVPMNPWDTVAPKGEQPEHHTAGDRSRLERLESQYRAGLLSKEEYQKRKSEIIEEKL